MTNPAPVLDVSGTVYAVTPRTVEPVPARPEERDENGNLLKTALPARQGYEVVDVSVLTTDGGFTTVSLLPDALAAVGGVLPSKGDAVSYPVRAFVRWVRNGSRSYNTVAFSVAGEVLKTRAEREGSGRRLAAASS